MTDMIYDSPAARMWGSTGPAYDGISFGLSDTISHAVQVLWPRAGERILDIGTGTGWAARLAAGRGARVTAVDIAPGMLKAAATLSERVSPRPRFVKAAAEALPFDDGSFTGVLSTYGIIFTPDPSSAINEMARVLRPGGRVALATWADDPEGYIARFFGMIGQFSDAPPPSASPFDWGRPDWLSEAMGEYFDVGTREQTTFLYAPDIETVWTEYVGGFGPVAAKYQALPADRKSDFQEAFQELHRPFETKIGLVIPRLALLVKAMRR